MAIINGQIKFEDVDPDYAAFLDKFKPKKTTDDCYTPDNVYQAVLDWTVKEYGIDPNNVVRPFWPGGDYERYDYPEGCTVVDNPPFSIIAQICDTYILAGIKFLLFAPYLTNLGICRERVTHLVTDARITYENGAEVNTAFVTNLESDCLARTVPDLRELIVEADKVNRTKDKPQLPKYEYPSEIVTSAMLGNLSKYGIDFRIMKRDAYFVRALESQRAAGKAIFGAGFLLSTKAAAEKAAAEKAAAEKAAAEKWTLSDREREIIQQLGKDNPLGINPYQE